MNAFDSPAGESAPLGLARALRTLPAVAVLSEEAFDVLHRECLDRLTMRLAARLTAGLDVGQLDEYGAAAVYQSSHPGTGDHTRGWIAANLPDDRAAFAEELGRILQETNCVLLASTDPACGNA